MKKRKRKEVELLVRELLRAYSESFKNQLLDEITIIRKNYKSGTALGMLETIERRIKALK